MKILLSHNFYQIPGGEDSVYADEAKLLESNGHEVLRYERDNESIRGWQSLLAAGATIWNTKTYREIKHLLTAEKIDLVHCTNTFPLISPSIYYACNKVGVPVVQSLHNYRLFCANSYFLRDGKVCEDCLGKRIPWPAVAHGCYRESRLASATVAVTQSVHHAIGSWSRRVDAFIALTDFAKSKCIEGGIPAERVFVKPNFVDRVEEPNTEIGDSALFVGRLSPEKGIDVLLNAWKTLSAPVNLKIVGGGPLESVVREAAARDDRIEYLGYQESAEVFALMRAAKYLVVPSIWYEGLPRTIVEAFSVGTPVVASAIGPMNDLVREGAGGLRFEPGNPQSLANAVAKLEESREELVKMRLAAHEEFQRAYRPDTNYRLLMQIYAAAKTVANSRS